MSSSPGKSLTEESAGKEPERRWMCLNVDSGARGCFAGNVPGKAENQEWTRNVCQGL